MKGLLQMLFRCLALPLLALPLLSLSAAAQDGGYLVRPGDTLRIEVLEDPSLNRSVLVSPDGRVNVPLAGGVAAAGKPVEVIQAELAQMMAANFAAAPNVYVSLQSVAPPRATGGGTAAPATIDIYVIGKGAQPGKYSVAPGTTVLQLFAQMGGFTKFAATKRIVLRRTDRQGNVKAWRIDYDAIEAGTDPGTTVLRDDDVIVVPQRKLFE